MAAEIDRDKVRESFHRQATDYDRHAVVQGRVVDKVLALLQAEQVAPASLLDIGAGTGRLLARLTGLYPEMDAVGADLAPGMCEAAARNLAGRRVRMVNADAESLPFDAESFDVVVSTSTYQWLATLDQAFAEARRVLKPGGVFCFALFGERTLFELRESYRAVLEGGADRTHSFFAAAEVSAALERVGFCGPRVSSELEVEMHPDVPELLRSLKKIGAGSTAPASGKGLSERRVMLEMMASYRKRFGREDGVPATYEVVYGVARKKGRSESD
ncbi:methyltransferase domain-containing protein [Geomonas paludis]|uniref:Malonyl-[acyl-carrier protein] O-methyltransferase n=1 Tax=Geomonas paludis TaxID=2740185 RepID=A0A6V8MZK8_9BACT|nr:methyltransferase domain-containing protein [Geomonas paludis]UPU36852.1 methyltransferase domain-containing protein [Geomonas paludis]GFO65520.1 malonyl-[acyl-carrier protein] O-methyltransferase [Geomonas paludis]